MTPPPVIGAREREIADVRVRRGWRGKAVVQVRYQMARPRLTAPENPTIWERAGLSEWRDADADDMSELIHIMWVMRLGLNEVERLKANEMPPSSPTRR